MEVYARCRNMAKGGMKEIHYGEHWGGRKEEDCNSGKKDAYKSPVTRPPLPLPPSAQQSHLHFSFPLHNTKHSPRLTMADDPSGWSLTESDPQVFTQLLKDLGVKGLQVVGHTLPNNKHLN